jgi:hypothetical protein
MSEIRIGQIWRATNVIGNLLDKGGDTKKTKPLHSKRSVKIVDSAGADTWLARILTDHTGKKPRKTEHMHLSEARLRETFELVQP